MKGLLPKFVPGIRSYGLKNIMNPATNTAAMATITTQTQIEALASFLSSISITSFVAIQMPIEREGEPDFFCKCEERELTCSVTLQSLHRLPSIEVLGRIKYLGQLKTIY
jgi:hypothetical protein